MRELLEGKVFANAIRYVIDCQKLKKQCNIADVEVVLSIVTMKRT